MDLGKLALSMVVTLGLSAGQPGPCPGPRPPAPCPLLEMAGPLDLNQKQQDQIRQKFEAHAKSMEAKRTETHKARQAVMQAMGDPTAKPEQLRALAAKEAQTHLDELLEGHALLQETDALLTNEQRAKLAKMRSEHPFPGPGGPGGPRQPGPGFGGPGRPGHPGAMPPPPPCDRDMEEPPREGGAQAPKAEH